MTIAGWFAEYAAAFELTVADDNWDRLAKYFHPQAVYSTRGLHSTRIEGRLGVLNALQTNVSGFDRKCDSRLLRTIEGPVVEDHVLTRVWQCEFTLRGAENLLIEGRETATYAGSSIIHLQEEIFAESAQRMSRWLDRYGAKLEAT